VSVAPATFTARDVPDGDTRYFTGTPRTAASSVASITPSRFGTQDSGAAVPAS